MADNTQDNSLNPDQIAEKGQKYYEEILKSKLEPTKKGKFVAIEVESGEYFIGDTVLDALQRAKEKYPNKLMHTVKIGFDGVFKMGSYVRGFSYGG